MAADLEPDVFSFWANNFGATVTSKNTNQPNPSSPLTGPAARMAKSSKIRVSAALRAQIAQASDPVIKKILNNQTQLINAQIQQEKVLTASFQKLSSLLTALSRPRRTPITHETLNAPKLGADGLFPDQYDVHAKNRYGGFGGLGGSAGRAVIGAAAGAAIAKYLSDKLGLSDQNRHRLEVGGGIAGAVAGFIPGSVYMAGLKGAGRSLGALGRLATPKRLLTAGLSAAAIRAIMTGDTSAGGIAAVAGATGLGLSSMIPSKSLAAHVANKRARVNEIDAAIAEKQKAMASGNRQAGDLGEIAALQKEKAGAMKSARWANRAANLGRGLGVLGGAAGVIGGYSDLGGKTGQSFFGTGSGEGGITNSRASDYAQMGMGGATTGAEIGSMFGPVGTAVGGGIGALAGLAVAAYKDWPKIKDGFTAMGSVLSDFFGHLGDWMNKNFPTLTAAAKSVGGTIGTAAGFVNNNVVQPVAGAVAAGFHAFGDFIDDSGRDYHNLPNQVGSKGRPGKQLPLNIRNNNPGNIRDIKTGQFRKFDSMEEGVVAMARQIQYDQDKHGITTIRGLITRWAPSSDNNDTEGYIKFVSSKMKDDKGNAIGPDDPIDLHDARVQASLVAAMSAREGGMVPYKEALMDINTQRSMDAMTGAKAKPVGPSAIIPPASTAPNVSMDTSGPHGMTAADIANANTRNAKNANGTPKAKSIVARPMVGATKHPPNTNVINAYFTQALQDFAGFATASA
jgi:hypothetical protein